VRDILLDVVRGQQGLLRNPEPSVLLQAFSASTLDFEIRAFLADILSATAVKSELRAAILERLRAEKIAIGGPAAPEVPVKISPEGAEILTALLGRATEDIRRAKDGG